MLLLMNVHHFEIIQPLASVAQLVGLSSCKPKGHGSVPSQGHMPSL